MRSTTKKKMFVAVAVVCSFDENDYYSIGNDAVAQVHQVRCVVVVVVANEDLPMFAPTSDVDDDDDLDDGYCCYYRQLAMTIPSD